MYIYIYIYIYTYAGCIVEMGLALRGNAEGYFPYAPRGTPHALTYVGLHLRREANGGGINGGGRFMNFHVAATKPLNGQEPR